MAEDCLNCLLTFGPNLYIVICEFLIIDAQLRYILNALNPVTVNNIGSFTVRVLAIAGDYSRSCSGQFRTEADVSAILLIKIDAIH